jgi:pyruvate/2-oxoglutarate dehydrogenase complex dihydrolipoamide acyltransferase (E2) component
MRWDMKLRFRWTLVPTTLACAAIAIVGCGGSSEEPSEEPTAETTTEATTAEAPNEPETASAESAPTEGTLAECEAVQEALDDNFNNGFGATLSSDSGIIKEDDSVFEASVAAAIAADGMDDALDDAKEVLEELTAATVNDAELLGYRDAYIDQLNALIPELESAEEFYKSVDEALEEEDPDATQISAVQESFTRTQSIAETIETIADELDDIDDDVFDYCLDAELDAEFGQ